MNKLQKFQQLGEYNFVFQHSDPSEKLDQLKQIIVPTRKVILELAAGQGEYTFSLAQDNPKDLFIAVDIQGERLYELAAKVSKNLLDNVIIVRTYIAKLESMFLPNTIDTIWITFPDPFPKDRDAKKRLSSPDYINLYNKLLKPKGTIIIKTDDADFAEYSLEQLQLAKWDNITKQDVTLAPDKLMSITTKFERKWRSIGKNIYAVKANTPLL